MYEQIVGEIQGQAKRLGDLQRESVDALQRLQDEAGNRVSLALSISDGERSLSDLDTLASTLVKFTEGYKGDKNWSFVPRNWLVDFSEALKNTANSFDNLKANLVAVDAQHGGLGGIDAPAFVINTKSGTAIDLRKILGGIALNIDKAFEAYFRLRAATAAPRLSEFDSLFTIFATRRTELDSLSKELSQLATRGREAFASLKAASDATKTTQAEVAKLREDTEKDRKLSSENSGESSQRLEAIRAVQKSADELSATVANSQALLTQFQTQLDARNKTYEGQKSSFDTLKADLDLKGAEIVRLTQQAEDMLKGATSAGLAASFSQKQGSTDSELKKASLVYYVSIGLLVLLTLPIFFYSFPPEFIGQLWKLVFHTDAPTIVTGSATKTFEDHVINLLGRAVFLIPGFLFVRFSSARHRQLFRLREDYSYKYSIAASVEGFMKQAKVNAEDIAYISYLQLAYNPADKMDHKSDDSELPPLWEKIVSTVEGRFPKSKPTMP